MLNNLYELNYSTYSHHTAYQSTHRTRIIEFGVDELKMNYVPRPQPRPILENFT